VLVQAGDASTGLTPGGAVQIDTGGTYEILSLWSGSLDTFSPSDQVMLNMWVYLLKQSLVSSVPVTIYINASGTVESVIFGTAVG
jgi:hypothetical protein